MAHPAISVYGQLNLIRSTLPLILHRTIIGYLHAWSRCWYWIKREKKQQTLTPIFLPTGSTGQMNVMRYQKYIWNMGFCAFKKPKKTWELWILTLLHGLSQWKLIPFPFSVIWSHIHCDMRHFLHCIASNVRKSYWFHLVTACLHPRVDVNHSQTWTKGLNPSSGNRAELL